MPCACLSRRKERPKSVPPLQTNFRFQTNQSRSADDLTAEPLSPGLKFGRLTLLARIEKVFHYAKTEKLELPSPIRPESIVGMSFHPAVSREPQLVGNNQNKFRPAPPNISELLPAHPDSTGIAVQSGPSTSKNLVPEIPLKSRSPSLIIQPHARNSQYAVVLDTSHHLQPPISPEPMPSSSKSNTNFQSPFQLPTNPVSSLQSDAVPGADSGLQHVTVLRPRFNDMVTPPLTPPPNIPLPPIPAAAAAAIRPRNVSFDIKENSAYNRSSQYLPVAHRSELNAIPSGSRPRSKSSPLRSEVTQNLARVSLVTSRQLRSLSSPESYISESEATDDTSPTSEESLPNELPIALFECSYSPPPPPPIIQDFSKQLFHQATPRYQTEI